jgi:hypothetical protein
MDPNKLTTPPQAPYQMPPHPGQPSQAPTDRTVQPAAYDQQGNPLYSQPPQSFYFTRPVSAVEPPISPGIAARNEQSRKDFPQLNLSEGEYIISAIKRHPIGLIRIWAIAFTIIAAFMALFGVLYMQNSGSSLDSGSFGASGNSILLIGGVIIALMVVLVTAGAMVATYVYNNNRFYLTNESVIQEIQNSLFSRNEQTVSLSNIEDASYDQSGIIPSMFNYGRIRLSTEGDETTYRFNYVADPKRQVAVLNNAVEGFKNGRPVEMPHQDQAS